MYIVILTSPAVEIFLEGTAAVSCVVLTNVVAQIDPFHRTIELLTNEEPSTVNVIPPPPAYPVVGLIDVILGWGLGGVGPPPPLPPPPPPQPASANDSTKLPIAPKPRRAALRVVLISSTNAPLKSRPKGADIATYADTGYPYGPSSHPSYFCGVRLRMMSLFAMVIPAPTVIGVLSVQGSSSASLASKKSQRLHWSEGM